MEIIKVNPGSNVFLGRQGENLAREIVFSIAPWVETYGQGNAQLLYRRKGDRDPYLVAVQQEGSEVHWSVSKPDTDVSGAGFYELHYYSGQTLVKSATGDTFVEGTMTAAIETPDPYKSWVDRVIEAAQSVPQTVEAALQEAKESGEFDGPKGDPGDQGDSAYDVAVKNGYEGTEEEWIAELQGNAAKSAAEAAESAAKAEEAKENALVSANQTHQAVISASNFVGHASAHAANAKTASESAQAAASRAENAERNTSSDREQVAEMKANTRQYQTAAANSETNAKTSETNAAASAEEAKKAAEEAKNAGGVKTVNGQKPDENGNVEIEVGSGSGVEVTAKPGQLIRVKETDENGNPTAWEAVPWGYTEGETIHPIPGELLPEGVPYVEKGETVEILAECQPPFDGDEMFSASGAVSVEPGATCQINWNGVPYICTAQDLAVLAPGAVLLGNGTEVGFPSNGEPFVIMVAPIGDGTLAFNIFPFDGSTEVTISISRVMETVHKLEPKLLPDEAISNVLVVTTKDDFATATHTAGEIFGANFSGKAVLFAGTQTLPLVDIDIDANTATFESFRFLDGNLWRAFVVVENDGTISDYSQGTTITI